MLVQLPLYECHKQVRAAKITDINLSSRYNAVLTLEGYGPVTVTKEWLVNRRAEVGGYFVQYLEGDDYTSFSPAAPFEGGYTLIKE